MKPSPRCLATRITDRLRNLGSGSRQGHRPSAQADFGVYTPDLRCIVHEFKPQLAEENGGFVFDLALHLIAKKVTECRQVAYELTASHKVARNELTAKRVEQLGEGLDNWACVDNFCSYISGHAWRTGQISDSRIKLWANRKSVWWRRVAIVSTVALNTKSKGGTGDVKRTLAVCEPMLDDGESTIQRAISWAIRELVPWDREAVMSFLESHQDRVSPLVRREVLRKLTTGKKN